VALVAGLSRAAHFGVLIKGAQPLEALTGARTLILDKTGTLTDGRPRVAAIEPCDGWPPNELLRLAAAADQASRHPMARAIVAAARAGGMDLPVPADVSEEPGEGITARVGGHLVIVGGTRFVRGRVGASTAAARRARAGSAIVAVAIDGRFAGSLVLADILRPETAGFIADIRRFGIRRILLATGDRRDVAEAVALGLGLDGVHAGLAPEDKVRLVLGERQHGPVMMVGDGVNDAPALAAAAIGVAMGARGSAASAEAADVVLLVDDLGRLVAGLHVAVGARRIALQSVVAGIGLSVAGMFAAALGHLTPVQGALLQEVIDIAVIVNALRALRIAPPRPDSTAPQQRAWP
jgi:P-type E1-E2 ATPase